MTRKEGEKQLLNHLFLPKTGEREIQECSFSFICPEQEGYVEVFIKQQKKVLYEKIKITFFIKKGKKIKGFKSSQGKAVLPKKALTTHLVFEASDVLQVNWALSHCLFLIK